MQTQVFCSIADCGLGFGHGSLVDAQHSKCRLNKSHQITPQSKGMFMFFIMNILGQLFTHNIWQTRQKFNRTYLRSYFSITLT